MINLRLFATGAALAAGIHYITKKRPDGSSIFEDFKAKAPDLMNRAEPYIDRLKGQFSKVPHMKGNTTNKPYPEKFNNLSQDPASDYSS